MNWGDFLQQGLLKVLYALALFSVVYLVYILISHVGSRETLKSTEVIQAMVAVALSIAAVFGIFEYKQIRRPYVSLMNVKAISNLSDPDMPVKVPGGIHDEKKYGEVTDELKENIGKYVPAKYLANAPDTIKDLVEEILVDLYFKNTGPLAATNCQIRIAYLIGHGEKSLSDLWDELGKMPTGIFLIADDVILNPQQEQTYNFMFHRNANGFKRGDSRYVLCDIRYNSIKDVKKVTGKEESLSREFKRSYGILNLYKIWYAAAWTDIIYSNLIKGEIPN